MKIIKFLLFFLFISISIKAQLIQKDTVNKTFIATETDTIFRDTIQLEEIVIFKGKIDVESRKQFELLKNRVYKTYPYAKLASERLTTLNRGMASLKTNKEKRKYFKIVEDYLNNEFEAKLKKLSRKQGQILIKLIHRQTGVTTYEVNEDYLIETILVRAFDSGRLINQTPAKPMNYDDLTDFWLNKATKTN
jgi:hypothetical protein